jgi:hypothetical protein
MILSAFLAGILISTGFGSESRAISGGWKHLFILPKENINPSELDIGEIHQ